MCAPTPSLYSLRQSSPVWTRSQLLAVVRTLGARASRVRYSLRMEHVIELFVAHHCPSCTDARRRIREFVKKHPNVTVIERNVDESVEAAETYGLFATPAIVVDRRSVFYGVPTLAQLAARCTVTEAAAADAERRETPRQQRGPGAGLTTAPGSFLRTSVSR